MTVRVESSRGCGSRGPRAFRGNPVGMQTDVAGLPRGDVREMRTHFTVMLLIVVRPVTKKRISQQPLNPIPVTTQNNTPVSRFRIT